MSNLTGYLLPFILLAAAQANAYPLFDADRVIDVELVGPLGSLIKNKDDKFELPFVLSANGVDHEIQVRVRGKSRMRVCNFPMLRLNFLKEVGEDSIFVGQDKLKMVTHCRNNRAAQADMLQEFAVYRIFNELTSVGYKVRLLRVTYTDTDGRFKPKLDQHFAFLIESQNELAARVGGEPANITGVSLRSLDDGHAALVYVFQYLVGNTDWSFVMAEDDDACCHNGDIVEMDSVKFYVPYDFDLTGLVNARYAYPAPSLRIRKVTHRLYRGFCTERSSLRKALATVKARQEAILKVLSEMPGLPEKVRIQSVDYLGQFFTNANNEENLISAFEKRCL